jgi:hypothetical protein
MQAQIIAGLCSSWTGEDARRSIDYSQAKSCIMERDFRRSRVRFVRVFSKVCAPVQVLPYRL